MKQCTTIRAKIAANRIGIQMWVTPGLPCNIKYQIWKPHSIHIWLQLNSVRHAHNATRNPLPALTGIEIARLAQNP